MRDGRRNFEQMLVRRSERELKIAVFLGSSRALTFPVRPDQPGDPREY